MLRQTKNLEAQAQRPISYDLMRSSDVSSTVSPGDPPPAGNPFTALMSRLGMLIRFVFATIWATIVQVVVYSAFLVALPFLVTVALGTVPTAWLDSLVEPLTAGAHGIGLDLSVLQGKFVWFVVGLALSLFLLNSLSIFYEFHKNLEIWRSNLNLRVWRVPRYHVGPDEVHFGFLRGFYSYNKHGLAFVLAGNSGMFFLERELIVDARVLHNAPRLMRGDFKNGSGKRTPPVVVFLKQGDTRLRHVIHGKFFEDGSSGEERAEKFSQGLVEQMKGRKDVEPAGTEANSASK